MREFSINFAGGKEDFFLQRRVGKPGREKKRNEATERNSSCLFHWDLRAM